MFVRCLNVRQMYKYTYEYKRTIKEKRNKEKRNARVHVWVRCNDEMKGAHLYVSLD